MNLWQYVSFFLINDPLIFILVVIMIKCLLISFYMSILYLVIKVLKATRVKMGARSSYYCWYALLLAFPLSGFDYHAVVTLPLLELSSNSTNVFYWQIIVIVALLWFLVLLFRLETQIVQNIKIEGAVSLMKDCSEMKDLKLQVAGVLKLSSKRLNIVVTDCINSPVSYGIFKRVILLPYDYKSCYSKEELYLLLLHEMAHFKNGDIGRLYFLALFKCLFFIPPSFFKEFKRDSEILCDNRPVSVCGVDRRIYSELLLRECAKPGNPVKGLAFSDSFYTIKCRLDALQQLAPEKHRFAPFKGIIFAVLLISFVWSYTTPAKWYRSNGSFEEKYNIIVGFDDEDISQVTKDLEASIKKGIMPGDYPDRPGRDYFADTIEWVDDSNILVDYKALYERVSKLDRRGAKVNVVIFVVMQYRISPNYPYGSYYETPISTLETAANTEQDIAISFNVDGLTDFYSFMAHWF